MGQPKISIEVFDSLVTGLLAITVGLVGFLATVTLDKLQDFGRDIIGTLCECKDNPPEVDKKCSKCRRRKLKPSDIPIALHTAVGISTLGIGVCGQLHTFPVWLDWINWTGLGLFPLVALSIRIWSFVAVTATKRAIRHASKDQLPELQRLLDCYHIQKKRYRAADSLQLQENPPSIVSTTQSLLLLGFSMVLCALPVFGDIILFALLCAIWLDIGVFECGLLRKFVAWDISHEITEGLKLWTTPGKRRNAALRYEQLTAQLKDPSLGESERRQIVQERVLLKAEEKLRFAKEMRVLGMDSTRCTRPNGKSDDVRMSGILSDFCYHCEMASLDRVTEVVLKKLSAAPESSEQVSSVEPSALETPDSTAPSASVDTPSTAVSDRPLSSQHSCWKNLDKRGNCLICAAEKDIETAQAALTRAQAEYEGATATRQFLLFGDAQKASKN